MTWDAKILGESEVSGYSLTAPNKNQNYEQLYNVYILEKISY